jgi:hypothetical protein
MDYMIYIGASGEDIWYSERENAMSGARLVLITKKMSNTNLSLQYPGSVLSVSLDEYSSNNLTTSSKISE